MRHALAALLLTSSSLAGGASFEESYMKNCAVCHLPGINGAPKVGDKAEWTARIRPGISTIYRNAIKGIPNTAMMAKGGHDDLSDAEIKAIVDYMIGAAGIEPTVLKDAARYDALGITDADFIALDRDFDGGLSRNEVAADAVLARHFARFDANRDGKLSEAEYRTAEATLERERAAVDVPDEALVAAVRAALAKMKDVDLPNTKVEAERGTVAIVGIVGTPQVVKDAYAAVKRIAGIKKIDMRLVSGHQMGWD
ncbi:MAG TPA: c-type cytochrome [Burkholderiales bacterium]|nr:c-type cytochrome [Burkholderiales bacterium]